MSFGHERLAIRSARNRPSTPWWESIPIPIAIPTPRRTEAEQAAAADALRAGGRITAAIGERLAQLSAGVVRAACFCGARAARPPLAGAPHSTPFQSPNAALSSANGGPAPAPPEDGTSSLRLGKAACGEMIMLGVPSDTSQTSSM